MFFCILFIYFFLEGRFPEGARGRAPSTLSPLSPRAVRLPQDLQVRSRLHLAAPTRRYPPCFSNYYEAEDCVRTGTTPPRRLLLRPPVCAAERRGRARQFGSLGAETRSSPPHPPRPSLPFPSPHFAKPSKAPSGSSGPCAALLAKITFSPGLLSLSSVNSPPVIHCFNSSLWKKKKKGGGGRGGSKANVTPLSEVPLLFAFLRAHCKQILWTAPSRGRHHNDLIS